MCQSRSSWILLPFISAEFSMRHRRVLSLAVAGSTYSHALPSRISFRFPLAPGLRFGLKKSEEVDDSISSALGKMRQEPPFVLPSPICSICSWASAFTGKEGSIIEAIDLTATEIHSSHGTPTCS